MTNRNSSPFAICIAGPLGAGKTTLARGLCRSLGGAHVSFGRVVVSEANRRGLPPEREILQALGQEMLEHLGPKRFVDLALSLKTPGSSPTDVFDSVRHLSIWQVISSRSGSRILVYVDVDERVAIQRLCQRDGIDANQAARAASHPMEKEARRLRAVADQVLDNAAEEELLRLALLACGRRIDTRPSSRGDDRSLR